VADFVKIAKVSDFERKRVRSYRVLARPVAIFREPDGGFFAVEASCKHQNADLTTGRVDGYKVTCPRHGWEYDVRTGECLNHRSAPLRRYEVKVEGEDIYVSIRPVSE
jgi:nitrite reductase/ring-hydroxylating ferredoxin subunit